MCLCAIVFHRAALIYCDLTMGVSIRVDLGPLLQSDGVSVLRRGLRSLPGWPVVLALLLFTLCGLLFYCGLPGVSVTGPWALA